MIDGGVLATAYASKMHCVVVTGAGASKLAGPPEQPLPLMDGWCKALVGDLNEKEPGLADAMGLQIGMTGQQFEEAMGLFFQWQASLPLTDQFASLFSQPVTGRDQHLANQLLPVAQGRAAYAMEVINASLYRLFGSNSIDDDRAASAYQQLLGALGDPENIAIVTTNYDSAAEIGLSGLGWTVEDGFVTRGRRTPHWEGTDVIAGARGGSMSAGVIHLHGATGWYDAGTQVERIGAERPFDVRYGRPVVLYPDPEKDPTKDLLVQQLWTAFDDALAHADRAVIIGHSMQDDPLVQRLRGFGSRDDTKLAIGLLRDSTPEELERVRRAIPEADQIGLTFGPEGENDLRDLRKWVHDEAVGGSFGE